MRSRFPYFIVLILLASLAAGAAEFWEKKKYTEWSDKECRKLLTASPWAERKVADSEVNIFKPSDNPVSMNVPQEGDLPPIDPQTGDAQVPNPRESTAGATERQQRVEMFYVVQVRSAAPIRQAFVRLNQLVQKYDQMAPEQKQQFEQWSGKYLASEFPDTVIVYMEYGSNADGDAREMNRYWRNQTAETLKNFTYLIGAKGVKAPLQQYGVEQSERRVFQFVFPRTVNGQPIVGPEDKSLQVEFVHPNLRKRGEKRVLVEFKVNKMMVDGQLVY